MIDILVEANVRHLLIESRSIPVYYCLIDETEFDDGLLWTRIFHLRPHSIDETRFYLVKMLFLEKSESPLFLFYFKGKIKQEIKP